MWERVDPWWPILGAFVGWLVMAFAYCRWDLAQIPHRAPRRLHVLALLPAILAALILAVPGAIWACHPDWLHVKMVKYPTSLPIPTALGLIVAVATYPVVDTLVRRVLKPPFVRLSGGSCDPDREMGPWFGTSDHRP